MPGEGLEGVPGWELETLGGGTDGGSNKKYEGWGGVGGGWRAGAIGGAGGAGVCVCVFGGV